METRPAREEERPFGYEHSGRRWNAQSLVSRTLRGGLQGGGRRPPASHERLREEEEASEGMTL